MSLINIYVYSFCVLVCLTLLFFLRTSKYRREKLNTFLSRIVLCSIIPMLATIARYALAGNTSPVANLASGVCYFLIMAFGPLLLAAFTQYLVTHLGEKTRLSRPAKIAVYIAYLSCAADIVCLIISQFNHMYYTIDEFSVLKREKMIWLSDAFSYVCMGITSIIILSYRRHLTKRETVSMLSYVILPILAMPISAMGNGLEPILPMLTLAILIFYAGIQNDQEIQLQQKELELSESRIAIMLGQIHPHFLLNSLISIEMLCESEPAKAQRAINDFALYLRGNMDSLTNKKLIPFEQELSHVRAYLAMEQMRYGDNLRVEYEIGAKDFVLPPLTLQPIVENAVRHGIARLEGGGTVTIRSFEAQEEWIVTVHDDGMGPEPGAEKGEQHTHIGINNVRERIALIQKGRLELEYPPGSGATASIYLPKSAAREPAGFDAYKPPTRG